MTACSNAVAIATEFASKNRDVIRAHKQLMRGEALRLCGIAGIAI